jgi:hypothetical protein
MSKPEKPKSAYGTTRALVKSFVEETAENPKMAKTHGRFVSIYESLDAVKEQINEKIAKIAEARTEVTALTEAIAVKDEEILVLRNEIENEPKLNIIEVRRLASAFTRISSNIPSTPMDSYYTKSEPDAVLSRLKPIADPEAGVVGIKIMLNDKSANVIMIHDFISACELRDQRDFEVDVNADDALLVYKEAMTVAFAIADAYVQLFGAYHAVPFSNQHTEEDEKILPGYVVAGRAGEIIETEDESEEESEDFEGTGAEGGDDESEEESDDDVEPSAEEIANRSNVDSEDDDVDE